jgi:hypothetical protein
MIPIVAATPVFTAARVVAIGQNFEGNISQWLFLTP